jgi:hypothetical protein
MFVPKRRKVKVGDPDVGDRGDRGEMSVICKNPKEMKLSRLRHDRYKHRRMARGDYGLL